MADNPANKLDSDDTAHLPDCGMYRTGAPLPGDPEHLPAGRLVYFHNHSQSGEPIVCCPEDNTHNRWSFQEQGHRVSDPDFIAALTPLMPQGLYVLKEHLHISKTDILPERTLVQLGYDREAMPILFPGRFAGNSIHFPESGLGFNSDTVFTNLEPVTFLVPDHGDRHLN